MISEIPGLYIAVDSIDLISGPLLVSAARKYACLFSGGLIVRGYPDLGLEMFQPDPTDPATGSYAASDNTLDIVWNSGQRSQAERLAPTAFRLFDATWVRLDRCTDLGLSGTYARRDGDPEWPRIGFRPDGTFQDEGVLSFTGLTVAPQWLDDVEVLRQIRGAGRWRVSNNTLYLDYAAAGQLTCCVYVPPGRSLTAPVAEIDWNGYAFVRQESLRPVPAATWTPGQL